MQQSIPSAHLLRLISGLLWRHLDCRVVLNSTLNLVTLLPESWVRALVDVFSMIHLIYLIWYYKYSVEFVIDWIVKLRIGDSQFKSQGFHPFQSPWPTLQFKVFFFTTEPLTFGSIIDNKKCRKISFKIVFQMTRQSVSLIKAFIQK